MSEDNIWLAGRRQEHDALGRVILKLEHTRPADGTVRAVRGAGVAARIDAITERTEPEVTGMRGNPDNLRRAAARKSAAAQARAEHGLREMIRANEQITFRGLAQTAGISLDFLYRSGEIRHRVEHRRSQQQTTPPLHPTPGTADHPSSVIRTLHRPTRRATTPPPRRGDHPQARARGRPRGEPRTPPAPRQPKHPTAPDTLTASSSDGRPQGLYLQKPTTSRSLAPDNQALDRTQPLLPIAFDATEKRTHDYVRHGTTNLFAALNVGTGEVVGECRPSRDGDTFLAFLKKAVKPHAGKEIHVVLDNLSTHTTPEVKEWLEKNPNVEFHFTPVGSSWLNQIETWFGVITRQAIRRGTFSSVKVLIKRIHDYIAHWNSNPEPFVWTATADEILAKVRLVQANIKKLLDNNAK